MQEDNGHLRALGLEEAKEQAEGPLADRVFQVGEKVWVKGGSFRIRSFGKKFMWLEGIPREEMT